MQSDTALFQVKYTRHMSPKPSLVMLQYYLNLLWSSSTSIHLVKDGMKDIVGCAVKSQM